MSGILPTAAESDTLTDMIASLLSSWRAALFSANLTPGAATTLPTLLADEASFTGYSRVVLSTWSAVTIDGTTAAIATSTQAQFTPTAGGGSGNLYGYFLVNALATKFFGVERFPSAPLVVAQNVTLEIDITYSCITRF